MKPVGPRDAALEVLLELIEQGRALDEILATSKFTARGLAGRDLALCRELSWGVCRWYFELRRLLAPRLRKPLRARDRDVEIILLLGVYQLLVMDVKPHAAVHQSVEQTRARGKSWAAGLVNAVLRGLVREGIDRASLDASRAYPEWMIARVRADWGERAAGVLANGTDRAPMTLRVDLRRVARDGMLETLAKAGIAASAHATVDSAICLAEAVGVDELPGFEQGLLSVQDAAAQLAAPLLDCTAGARVLDACAAPGGKTAHLLQHYPEIDLDALDIAPRRLERVAQNLRRIGLSARLITGDAAQPATWHEGEPYDAILADVPCSASGVMRRHPDIRLLRRESDIMPLVERQAELVDALWTLLKPGGRLLYCTCSIFLAENRCQVERFLQRHDDARVIDPGKRSDWLPQQPGAQILTGEQGMDGFYYALLAKAPGQ
ncbi:MAG: 16S rRNA (cytosine(967)-C(5))-methyltransferase RsmB [Gammaproteobacteria bacterium]|nr:16S rRNA (cytosine(967)-C(5))-methyltransferase RsmB [Gammaproteobacteria bacterium]